jgi:RNA polymerase sigma-70 factor (ECF subfamily)
MNDAFMFNAHMMTDAGANRQSAMFAASEEAGCEGKRTGKLREVVVRLFDELKDPVFRHLIYVGLNPDEADEVVQETFLRLYKHLLNNGGDENLRGWIFKVAHNVSEDRRKGRKYLSAIDPERWQSVAEARPDSGPTPEEALIRQERLCWLRTQLAALSPQQQQCMHLRVEGFRYREIADILDISISTVAEMLRRAVTRLSREASTGKVL